MLGKLWLFCSASWTYLGVTAVRERWWWGGEERGREGGMGEGGWRGAGRRRKERGKGKGEGKGEGGNGQEGGKREGVRGREGTGRKEGVILRENTHEHRTSKRVTFPPAARSQERSRPDFARSGGLKRRPLETLSPLASAAERTSILSSCICS